MGALGFADRVDPLRQPAGLRHESPDHESEAHQVVAEHGPAHEVHVEHDHETGRHTVHSVHEDGHEHDCEHDNVDEAHDHAKALATPQDDADEFEEDAPEYE